MSAENLVIVESPAKAKTINKYLGSNYEVMASFGHVRDLTAKDGSVLPDEDFAMRWELSDRGSDIMKKITAAAKKADTVYLATDPDREGEAISWHITQALQEKGADKGKTIKRVTFNEITKKAVQAAFSKPREIDANLVEAYLARRALDYLVGFNISPVLWRKLPGSKSAGRVQSVALRLISERETEIERFKPVEYWSVETALETTKGEKFKGRLTQLDGKKLDKFDIKDEAGASRAVAAIEGKPYSVASVEKKQIRRNPAAPFITSSLQMEASRKLRFSASQTMRTAQQLYEGADIGGETVGLITYMRTDGTTLSDDAIAQARDVIKREYGPDYLPAAPRDYKSKAKNAQEAHEAIRPTDLSRKPADVAKFLDANQAALYELIWKRTMASQMENAVLDQVSADIANAAGNVVLRASGSTVTFPGFLALYQEDEDDRDATDNNEEEARLPVLNEKDVIKLNGVTPNQHFTQPPPRYSEATLVKKLEELGIGRPSTYASIIQVLQDRKYVVLDKRRFIPEDRGRLVTTFLKKFFERYVDYDFTANLEEDLDEISNGDLNWKKALRDFWTGFKSAIEGTKDLTITQVLDHLDAELGDHFFPVTKENPNPRLCPTCNSGKLSLKLGKFGAFIGCSNYPECRHTQALAVETEGEDGEVVKPQSQEPKVLGTDPATGRTVSLRFGPYGPYVQIDAPEVTEVAEEPAPAPEEAVEEKPKKGKGKTATKTKKAAKPKKAKKPAAPKPKRQGLPKGTKPEDVTLESALKLLELPRLVGMHPETKEPIEAGVGRFGPFLKHQGKFKSIPKGDDVLSIGLNRAVDLLAQPANPARGRFAKKKKAG
ncbi:MAG: type I DNA topoisomerase [Alphaproteobacteria bacterium]|nr:type I DNA topoisomerase [Alphaproteobacteria bacterium]